MIAVERKLRQEYWKKLQDFKKEIEQENPGWIKSRKKSYLRGQMFCYLGHLIPFFQWYNEATERGALYIIKAIISIFAQYEKWEKKLKRAKLEYDSLSSHNYHIKGRLTQDMIEMAKEYPINQIIEVNKKNFALCPFHQDTHPSLYCKNNFYHCFSCGASGSTIDLYMKLHNVDFKQAVKFLSGGAI